MPAVVAASFCAAARSINDLESGSRLARILDRCRKAGLAIDTERRVSLRGPPAAALLDHLADERTLPLFRTAGRQRGGIDPFSPRRVYLGSLDPINATVTRLVEIHLRDAGPHS